MKKKGFLIATSAGLAAAMPGAQAADMPLKSPRPMVQPAGSWAGWYIGVHAGANWQQAHSSNNNPYETGGPFTTTATGFIGGGQLGYNWQRGNFVFGIEADGSWLTGKGKDSFGSPTPYATVSNSIRWLSTVRGRFGLAMGDTMAYATAGVAFGGVKNSHLVNSGAISYSESKTRTGWAVGGGIEHMLSRNWTIGLEGLFVDLGRSSAGGVFTASGTPGLKTTKFSNQAVIGRVKLNYKF